MLSDYALFDIRIRGAGPERYTVEVHSDLGGDASSAFVPPTAEPAYAQLAERLQHLEAGEDELIQLGQMLFQALFQSRIKDTYARAQGRLKEQQGQRLRFDIDPALTEIVALPWEFLYDADQGPLALLDTPIVRYLPEQAAAPTLAAQLPLKVLVTGAATPPAPEVERELAEVRAALSELEAHGYVSIQVEAHLTHPALQRRLREGFQIWHFIGHGGSSRDGRSGTLLFEDGTGSSKAVSAAELNILLNRSGVRLVMLDACGSAQIRIDPYRSIAPALIRAQIPAVIAMQLSVPQEATRAFAGEFYRALAEGFPIDACVTEGRKAIVGASGLRNPDWGIPVVYTRAPDGRLFAAPNAPSTPASAPSAPQSSGVNIAIGTNNRLEGSNIAVSNVGNNITSGSTFGAPAMAPLDDELGEQIATLEGRVATLSRVITVLMDRQAKMSVMVDSMTVLELDDNERSRIAAMDRLIALREERVRRLENAPGPSNGSLLAEAHQALLQDKIQRDTFELYMLDRKTIPFGGRPTPYDKRIAELKSQIAELEHQQQPPSN
ncbi:MAG TPA: CHAT domain-containing protein [Roseiflexaceae bacterium]|nr:CHAT domain-containing protein [Roseiflexaceae bacterium]